MKLTAHMTMIVSAIFAAVCLGFAVNGFMALGEIADPTQAADARGFAWYWTFLATIAIVFGAISWWLARTDKRDQSE